MKAASERKIAVIGLGYVGLPVATSFAKIRSVVGLDINSKRVEELNKGVDSTGEVERSDLNNSNIKFTDKIEDLRGCDFFIIAVPTPIDNANRPDLSALKSATEMVAQVIEKDAIVVYESTVYPGVTEEVCLPILEKLAPIPRCDYKIGYSPERINPGDKEHTFTKITKVVSGEDTLSLDIIGDVYASVVEAGVYKAESIKVAEAAKVIENTQRDLNISLMNELSLIFHKLGIDTNQVIDAAATKWNFLPFRPGLVGGHCIGVDPYYLTYKAERVGHIPQVILSGRRINDSIGKYIARNTIKEMIKAKLDVTKGKVGILGVTFKENCPDVRNSKVFDIVKELTEYGIEVFCHDPHASSAEVDRVYNTSLVELDKMQDLDAVVLAVSHKEFKTLNLSKIEDMCKKNAILVDVKNIVDKTYQFQKISKVWKL